MMFPSSFLRILLLTYILTYGSACYSQVERFEHVLLTRYFKPQVSYSFMTSQQFEKSDLKWIFREYIQNPPENEQDFRNFITFNESEKHLDIKYRLFGEVPRNPLVPDANLSSMTGTFLRSIVSPLTIRKYRKQKEQLKKNINSELLPLVEDIAKVRIMRMWGYDPNRPPSATNCFNYDTLLNVAKDNSNDLEEFIAQKSALKDNVFQDLTTELINRNFVVIYNLRECSNFKEYYNSNNIPVHRRLVDKDGINIVIEAYIFKINWTNDNQNYFFENCWFDDSNSSNAVAAIQNFQNMTMDLSLVYITGDRSLEHYIDARKKLKLKGHAARFKYTEMNSRESGPYGQHKQQVNRSCLNQVANNLHDNVRLNSDYFKLRSVLHGNMGYYSSTIGKKENLHINQRFVAYEIFKKPDGTFGKEPKGVLVSKAPEDNRSSKGVRTEFKQESGSKLFDGFILEEQQLSFRGFSFSSTKSLAKSYLSNDNFNLRASIALINLSNTRYKVFKGIYLDPFGIEYSGNSLSNLEPFWRPSITRTINIPKLPSLNLDVGVSLSYSDYLYGYTPFSGIRVPIGSNNAICLLANYGIVTDEDKSIDYRSGSRGLSLELKIIRIPNKKEIQSHNRRILRL